MSQSKAVLDYMLEGKRITSWGAINMFGATRLGAIIFDLKARGYNIKSELIPAKSRSGRNVKVSSYWLESV